MTAWMKMAKITIPTLGEVILGHATDRPDAVALRFGDRAWRYAELDNQANRIAHALLREGVVAGNRVAWIGRNSDALPLLAIAAARIGAILVPINWRLAPAEAAHILRDSGTTLLFAAPDLAATIVEPPCRMLIDDVVTGRDWTGEDATPPTHRPATTDTALLMYTSGTTGLPKGVMLSHRSLFGTNVMRQAAGMDWDRWSADDVTVAPIPLAHVGGFNMLLRGLFFGGEVIIQPAFDPGAVLDAIAHLRVSKIGLVPTAMKMVIDHPRARDIDYSRIETMIYGAAPITLDLLREAITVFGCDFAQAYGMTETFATCVALPPADHDVAGTPRMRAAGQAYPGTELRIVSPDGAPLPVGETGEVAIRSIAMMTGYWNMPEETSRVLDADGWYRTGDAGYLDADGYLFIKDRLKDMIVSGAENVYPAEVENALADHPDIDEVAVIGVPDPLWGEAVKAVVVAATGTIDEAAAIAWARTRIAGYKVPRSIDVVAELPRNASGKIDKRALRERYWAEAERQV